MVWLTASLNNPSPLPKGCDPTTRDDSLHGHNQMVSAEIGLIIFFTTKSGEALSAEASKIRPSADCGSDHEFLFEKFRLKLKKVWKTTGPFRYDLNQILFDYTVEIKNRFKGFDLVERVPEELWKDIPVTLYRNQ